MYESVFDDNNDIRWGVLAEKPDWVFGAEMVACKGRSSKFSSRGQQEQMGKFGNSLQKFSGFGILSYPIQSMLYFSKFFTENEGHPFPFLHYHKHHNHRRFPFTRDYQAVHIGGGGK